MRSLILHPFNLFIVVVLFIPVVVQGIITEARYAREDRVYRDSERESKWIKQNLRRIK